MRGSAPTPEAGSSLEALADAKKLVALRPSHRLYRAHPMLGLEEAEGRSLWPLEPHALGVRWLSLTRTEQRAREADFLRGLLRRAARYEGARFEAGWRPDADERTAALADACAVAVTPEATARGPLSRQAVEVLAADLPEVLVVDGGPELTVVTFDGWDGLGVWIDPWKREELERDLETSWWDEAQQRASAVARRTPAEIARCDRADRELRAQLFVGWNRFEPLLFSVLVAVSAALAWGDGLWSLVRASVSAAVLVGALDWLIRRWYHRSQREPE